MAARPSYTMRLEFSGPSLESLYGKRQYFPGERSRKLQTHGRYIAMLLEHFSIPEKLKLPSQKHLFDAKEAVRRHAQRRRKNKSSLVEEALELELEMGFTIDSDTSVLTLFKHARTMVDVTLSENKSLYIFQLDSKFRILCVKIDRGDDL